MFTNLITDMVAWIQASSTNFNIFLIANIVLMIIGFAVIGLFTKKLGKSDERTDIIKLQINYWTFGIGFAATVLFMFSVIDSGVENVSKLVLLPFTVTVIAGAIITVVKYFRAR